MTDLFLEANKLIADYFILNFSVSFSFFKIFISSDFLMYFF